MADFEDPTFGNHDSREFTTHGNGIAEKSWGFYVLGILRSIFSFIEAMFYSKYDAWSFGLVVCIMISLCFACICFSRTLFFSGTNAINQTNTNAKKVQ